MTDQAEGQGNWRDWEAKPLPVAEPFNAPTSIPITEQNKMTDLEDHEMIRSLVTRIGDYLVERTKLAERVKGMEQEIATLKLDLHNANVEADRERQGHNDTRAELEQIRNKLAVEQSTVHNLVAERDIVRDDLAHVNEALASVRRDVEFWQGEASRLERERNEATYSADVCREQREQMAGQVSALRAAFGALRVLE